jgi:hypothetical protein
MRVFEATETMEQAAAREMLAEFSRVKDEITSRLLLRDSVTSTEVLALQSRLREIQAEGRLAGVEEIFTRYQQWAWDEGGREVDEYIEGKGVADVLKLPESSVAQLATYGASRIVTIAPEYLDDIAKRISLAYVGQRSPQQVVGEIMQVYQRTAYRAETIVRTEIGTLQNAGTEARMQQAGAAGKRVGIRTGRVWIHSSGAKTGFAKGRFRARYEPRPHHKTLHGTVVELDEKFELTNPRIMQTWLIDGPHDENLPAGEVVSCYCKRALRIIEDKPTTVR